ncbi:alcohol dehydrogenase catalytic domain-containing protein, partial [Neglectibacter timonensis]
MLAAIVERPHEFVIKDIPRPDAGPKQVIIKTLACSICNATDNHILEGIFDGYHDRYPQIMGHEVCGEVVELGAEVTDLKLGDRIALYTPYGAFAEYVPVDVDPGYYAVVPDNLSDEEASICEMFDGAYTSTIACAELTPGERVLVVGAGP